MAYSPSWDLPDDPVTVSALGRDGLGRGVFRGPRFCAPTRGVRVPRASPDGLAPHLRAVGLVLPAGWAAHGPTAARLWSSPVPDHVDAGGRVLIVGGPVAPVRLPREELSAGAQAPLVRRRRVQWRRVQTRADEVTTGPGGVPVTTPERTFVDLAGLLPLPDLVAVGDDLLRRGLATRERLAEIVRRHRGRRGVRKARRALELLDPRSESPQESRLRVIIIEAGLPVPVPNMTIRDGSGGFIARGDLVYQRWRIVVEYDGRQHADPSRLAVDATRRTLLREHDWYVVEITAADLQFPQRAIAKVTAALRSRGAIW